MLADGVPLPAEIAANHFKEQEGLGDVDLGTAARLGRPPSPPDSDLAARGYASKSPLLTSKFLQREEDKGGSNKGKSRMLLAELKTHRAVRSLGSRQSCLARLVASVLLTVMVATPVMAKVTFPVSVPTECVELAQREGVPVVITSRYEATKAKLKLARLKDHDPMVRECREAVERARKAALQNDK